MEEKQIGLFIRDRRLALGLTQQQLADKLGITDKAVSKWERGISYPDITLLRRLAEERGLILLTDSDGAGFVIRNFLKGAIPKDRLKQAYIPDVYGKERRKAAPGREGKLGVEGMNPGVLLQALERAGATFEEERPAEARQGVTKADLYQLGLTGAPDSGARREALLRRLRLPERMSANALLEALETGVKTALGFHVTDHEVKLYGFCRDCLEKRKEENQEGKI